MSGLTFKVFYFFLGIQTRPEQAGHNLGVGVGGEGEMKGKEMRVSLRCAQEIDGKTGEEGDVGGERASDGGRADIKEAFVEASSSHRARIRAGERRTLRTLRGGIECLRCRTLSSRLSALNFFSFFFFIINYFSLIARIRKRGREKGRSGSLES